MAVFFRNVNIAPRTGFFYETHGEKVAGAHFCDIEGKVRALMVKYHIPGTVEQAVAEYMCPRISEAPYLCTGGYQKVETIFPKDAMKNSEGYASRQVVPADVIMQRLRTCMKCPKHTREFCVTCTGHMNRILLSFNGRRMAVPEDRGSGICKCAKAYESAMASVEYCPDEPVWPGAPDTCWRHAK